MKNKRWTVEEDTILAKNVIENYDNLDGIAFPKTAFEIGRTAGACSQRWYNNVKNNSICFASISEKKAYRNRKTLPKNYAEEYNKINKKKSRLKSLMSIIKKLFS